MTNQPPPEQGAWAWRPALRSPLDEQANTLERRWGIDRLPRLVSPETAARFQAAHDLHSAGPTGRHTAEQLDAMMARAWAALEQEAIQRGAEPLPPGIYETPLEGLPGAVAVIAFDEEHAQAVRLRAKHEGRTVSVWTMAEVVRVIQASEIVNKVKNVWPGAHVTQKRARVGAIVPEEIPFGGEPVEEVA